MINTSDFQKAIDLINSSSSILITTHTKPDGDACGGIVAISDALSVLGKKTNTLILSPVPKWYEFLFTENPAVLGKNVTFEELKKGQFGEFDLIVIIDTNSISQLPKFDQYLQQTDIPVLVIDHHQSSDNLGDIQLLDRTAAASCLIVFDLFKYAEWEITEKIAEALFTGIATDTGWFHFRNTDSRVYRCCGDLSEAGAEPTEIHRKIYQNFTKQRLALMAIMLNTLQLHLDGRYATQHLSQQDFEKTGASMEDTENFIDECQRIGTIEVAALFVELADGKIRCSLRSRGAVDVCQIAVKFGGGGHKTAAGAYLPGPIQDAEQLVLNEVRQRL